MAPGKQSLADRLQSFDRRWIFLAMGLAIVVPLLFPLGFPITPSPMVKNAFYAVEELKEGDRVLLSLDLDPASTPELEPFFRAVSLHLKRKGVRLVVSTTWYQAPPLITRWIRESIEGVVVKSGDGYDGVVDRPYKKNVDYVWLGFKEGREATINGMATDLRGTFDDQAADGTALADIELMDGIEQLSDFDLVIMVSAGYPGIKEFVQQAQGRGNVKMIGACTAVSTTDYTPYYNAGQLLGLVGGMAKAAEYEKLVGRPADAHEGADALSVGHLVIILAILFGNVIYFASSARRKARA